MIFAMSTFRWVAMAVMMGSGAGAQTLDFEVYKSRVEPVFLKKRPGHARCVACHAEAATAFRLQKLAPGASTWTEEQSRKNFEAAVRLVTPGDPASSRLLKHPLAPDGGGDKFHGGGRQFASPDDPEYKAIADWIRGKQ
jgi:hypothetical protein